jgi:hypothetical protein
MWVTILFKIILFANAGICSSLVKWVTIMGVTYGKDSLGART